MVTSKYFIGIAGTAMASVAVALKSLGCEVTGSDAGIYPPMSDFLASHGIACHGGYAEENIAAWIAAHPADASAEIVIGNAVSRGNPEVEYALNSRRAFVSLAALVGRDLIGALRSVVVTGTHGKTTTSALIAWTLESAGRAPGFLIGGVPENFGGGCRAGVAGGVFVSEGDEYDTAFFDKRSKFVHYRPDIAVINNIEFDHADIFDSIDEIALSFRRFISLIPSDGLLLWNGDDATVAGVTTRTWSRVESFGLGDANVWRAARLVNTTDGMEFDVAYKGAVEARFISPLAGDFNVRNALAMIAVCRTLGVTNAEIREALRAFKSVKRRMQVIGEIAGVTVIDDFAHHPTAVAATLRALRQRHQGCRLWALFEPRSNTSTRNIFQNEIAVALAEADIVLLGAVNRPERYAADEMLDTRRVMETLAQRGRVARHIPDADEMAAHVAGNARPGDVVAILSNGKFGGVHAKILAGLRARSQPR